MLGVPPNDPRWDHKQFQEITSQCIEGVHVYAWLKVEFVRELGHCGGKIGRRVDMPPHAMLLGTPPPHVTIYTVSRAWQTRRDPDPDGWQFRQILAILEADEAANDDLLLVDYCSTFFSETNESNTRSDLEARLFDAYLNGSTKFLFTYARIRTLVIPEGGLLQRGWSMWDLYMSSYCQRLLSLKGNEEVERLMREALDPVRLAMPLELFAGMKFTYDDDRQRVVDHLAKLFTTMPSINIDEPGFTTFCEQAQIAWLYVSYVRSLAVQEGPFPRRQEIPGGQYIVGSPPASCRKFVCSHGWESELHPSPSGSKMRRLAKELTMLHAMDTDVVFFYFCSLAQGAKLADCNTYMLSQHALSIPDRTIDERRAFKHAMWDMGRLYGFKQCEVIVIPSLDGLESFPGGNVWGKVNTRAYHSRGWCCAEFCIALYNQSIMNLNDQDVQRVRESRMWPTTVAEYADMMDENQPSTARVEFTNKGDRAALAAVQYNFFKMTMGPQSLTWVPPAEAAPAMAPSETAAVQKTHHSLKAHRPRRVRAAVFCDVLYRKYRKYRVQRTQRNAQPQHLPLLLTTFFRNA